MQASTREYTAAQAAQPRQGYRFWQGMGYALPLLLAWGIYGYSVTLPFFLDDGPHFQILRQTDGLRHWGHFPAFPFYRPFTFSLWKLFEGITGGHNPYLLHLLNLLCFGLAGVLLGQIIRRVAGPQGRMLAAVIGGCAFVLFPFSYQAVAMVAALFHLTLTFGLLLCLWLALLWLDKRVGWWALMGCWLAGFVAVFSHESGVLLPPLLLGLVYVAYGGRWPALKRLLWVLLPIGGLAVVYLALWLAFSPREGASLTTALEINLAVLLQGLAFPFVALLRPFVIGDIAPGLLLLVVLACVLLFLALGVWRAPAQRRLMLYGLGWYILAILPAVLFLPAGYVLGQPRLALLASVGGGIFWGVALAALLWPLGWFSLLSALLILLSAYISVEFLTMRRADFLRLRDYNQQAAALFEAHNVIESGAALVNAPGDLTPIEADRRFLLGTEGVLFVDATLDYNQQFWMNTCFDYANIEVFAFPEVQRSAGYHYRPHPPALSRAEVIERVRAAPQVYLTQFEQREFYPVLVGGALLNTPDPTAPGPLVFYPQVGITLLQAQASYDAHIGFLQTHTRWHLGQPAPVKLFVHVYCDDAFIAQSDGYPWGDTYPFSAWSAGESQTDIRHIRLGENVPLSLDCLRVYVGLYDEASLSRLVAQPAQAALSQDPEGAAPFPDDVFPIPLRRAG